MFKMLKRKLESHPDSFESFIDHLNDLVILMDHQAKIVKLNRIAEDYFGYRTTDIIGDDFLSSALSKNADVELIQKLEDFFKSPDVSSFRHHGTLVKDKNNFNQWLFIKNKNYSGIQLIAKQQIIEKEYKDLKALLDSFLNTIPGNYWSKDKNGVYLDCNKNLAENLKIQPHQLIGHTDYDLPWKDQADELIKNDQEVMRNGIPVKREETVISTDQSTHTFLVIKSPLRDSEGELIGTIGTSFDITDRKKAEEDLKAAKIIAEKANQLKTEFIENMQHDIRTPASGVAAMLDTLTDSEPDPERQKILALVRDSAQRLLEVCNELIDFDKVDRGETPLTVKKLSISQLVSSIIELNHAAAFNKKLTLAYEIAANVPDILKGDQHRVSRILINLVGNSIKFTEQGNVHLSVGLLKKQNNAVFLQFKIQDTGIGIPENKQEEIYEKFNRLSPANRGRYTGSGLGLQVVKKFISELNGEIELESKLGIGTIFYVNLPFEEPLDQVLHDIVPSTSSIPAKIPEQISSTPTVVEEISSNATKKILLIEDHALARLTVLDLFKKENMEIMWVESVAQALETLQKIKFDLVVSDLGLPDGTGFDIIGKIKKDESSLNHDTPFVALTAHLDQHKKAETQDSGFLMTLAKPLLSDQARHICYSVLGWGKSTSDS